MSELAKREMYLFDRPGEHNTPLVAEAVAKRVEVGDLRFVVVATSSGRTALAVARVVGSKARVIAITGAPYRRDCQPADDVRQRSEPRLYDRR